MTHKVYGFFGNNRFLSNFHPSTVKLDGMDYPTVEHAYQAAKTSDTSIRKTIRDAISPKEAKRLAFKLIKMDDGARRFWDGKKYTVMFTLCRQKFEDPELRKLLLETGQAELVEANWWNDTYWGVCNDQGENNLGKILMKIRDMAREEENAARSRE